MTDAIQDDGIEVPTEYSDEEEEPSLEEAFAKLWRNEKCHDIVLKCSDGLEVPANSFALAMRCKYFDKMLLGGYNESKIGVIESQYPGVIVEAVAEYLHTGEASILGFATDEKHTVTEKDVDRIYQLVLLTVAASYYCVPGLVRKVHKCILKALHRFPSLSLTLFQACQQNDQATSVEKLEKLSLTSIRSLYGIGTLNEMVCASLSEDVLGEVLKDEKLQLDESSLFELVRLWSCGAPYGRKSVTSDLIKNHIRLENIDPEFLGTTVADSGLVTREQRFAAFEQQALAAKRNHGVDFEKPRYFHPDLTWKSGGDIVVDLNGLNTGVGELLNFPNVTTDTNKVHNWTIKIEEADEGAVIWLGVVEATMLSSANLGSDFLGNYNQSFGFGGEGRPWLYGRQGFVETPKFHVGDEVTLTLDLRPEAPENGTLVLRHSSGYSNRKGRLSQVRDDFGVDRGATVAVSVSAGSKARFRFIRHTDTPDE